MTNAEFLKTFQKNSVKQYRDHILNYLYKDHKISAKEIYEQLEKDKNIDLNFGKRTFEKYVRYLREKYKIKKK